MRDELRAELEGLLTPVVEGHFAVSQPEDDEDDGDADEESVADREDAASAASSQLVGEVIEAVDPWIGRPAAFAGDQVPDEFFDAVAEAVSNAISEVPERPVDEAGLIADVLAAVRPVLARA